MYFAFSWLWLMAVLQIIVVGTSIGEGKGLSALVCLIFGICTLVALGQFGWWP